MNETEFSIVIPLYNGERHIKECIKSALNQSFDGNFEIIVVNDGSTDKSSLILTDFKDEKLRIFNNENKGPAFSRNFGTKEALGKYIVYLDSDDILDKNALQNFYDTIADSNEDTEPDIIFAPFHIIKEHKNNSTEFRFPLKKYAGKKCFLSMKNTDGETLKGNFEPWAKAYKKEFLFKNGIEFIEAHLAEDLPFFYKAVLTSKKILVSKNPVYYYRRGHKAYLKKGKCNWVKEVIIALKKSDEIFYSFKDFKTYEKIYAKNCLNICLYWAKRFKKLENKQDFYRFSGEYLEKYRLTNQFYIKLFISNLIGILEKTLTIE